MSIDKEQVLTAVRESFEDSELIKKLIEHMGDDEEVGTDFTQIKCKIEASNRERMWDIFSEEVVNHIRHYAVKQYGDYPSDQITEWNEEQLKTQIQKYLSRLESNQRGTYESDLDLIKIAHYAQMIWSKRLGFEDAFQQVLTELENKNNQHESEEKKDEQ